MKSAASVKIDSPLEKVSRDKLETLLQLYWGNFHPTFPILHKMTFRSPGDYDDDDDDDDATIIHEFAQNALVNIMCCIGLRYLKDDESKQLRLNLEAYVLKKLQTPSVEDPALTDLQASLLYIHCGIYSGNEEWFKKAEIELHYLIETARETGIFQNTPAVSQLGKEWDKFIFSESRRRISYAIYFIDSQLATLFNYPPVTSHYEIKHILPCSDELWEMPTAEDWEAYKESHVETQGLYFLEGLQDALIYGKMSKPTSSFGAMTILSAMHIMIRHMTQYAGILETVPSHAQDPFSRRSQLGNGLNGLRTLIPKNTHSDPFRQKTMWDLFEYFWNLAYIHLHLPDTVITSGIIEVSLDATVVTCATLAKPQSKNPPGIALLNNDFSQIPYQTHALASSHLGFFLSSYKKGVQEQNPAMTFMFYKACLKAWQILNVALKKDEAENFEYPLELDEQKRQMLESKYLMQRLAGDILCNLEGSTDYSDLQYFENWVENSLSSLNTWGIGDCASCSFRDMLMEPQF